MVNHYRKHIAFCMLALFAMQILFSFSILFAVEQNRELQQHKMAHSLSGLEILHLSTSEYHSALIPSKQELRLNDKLYDIQTVSKQAHGYNVTVLIDKKEKSFENILKKENGKTSHKPGELKQFSVFVPDQERDLLIQATFPESDIRYNSRAPFRIKNPDYKVTSPPPDIS
jgi:hypothetical protein